MYLCFFESPYLCSKDTRSEYKEIRFVAIGTIEGRVVVIVFTRRKNKIRIISMRKANEREKKKFKDRL